MLPDQDASAANTISTSPSSPQHCEIDKEGTPLTRLSPVGLPDQAEDENLDTSTSISEILTGQIEVHSNELNVSPEHEPSATSGLTDHDLQHSSKELGPDTTGNFRYW